MLRTWSAWSGYPWVVLVAAVLVQTSASFGNQTISPLAPFLLRDLGITRLDIGLLVTATYIGASFVLIPAGGLSAWSKVGDGEPKVCEPVTLISTEISEFTVKAPPR